jgi:hypothetical protein
MSNTKCQSCGLINVPDDLVCERCGATLVADETNARAPESEARPPESEVRVPVLEVRLPEPPRPDFPVLTLGGAATSSSMWKPVLAAILVAVVCGVGLIVYKIRVDSQRPGTVLSTMRRRLVGLSDDERTRETLLSYLARPDIAGTEMSEQVLGPVNLELLQLSDREVYFSAPAPAQSGETFDAMVSRILVDPKRIVMARDDLSSYMRLGDYSLRRSTEKSFFFKTSVDNVKFDTTTVLKFPFGTAVYTLDMSELSDFLQNNSIYGGHVNARTGQTYDGTPVVFANHGAMVARPGEASLTRFVQELTRGIPADAREARVQRVLDFVSREIRYDQREATYDFELLKRPNEVLMSGESDCSNKAILLGSLLEQLGEDYLLVYMPEHITVAVPQGRFPAANGLSLEWKGQTWVIAEGTAPGFRIGVDRLNDEERFKQFQYVQRPGERDTIFDLATGRRLSFQ